MPYYTLRLRVFVHHSPLTLTFNCEQVVEVQEIASSKNIPGGICWVNLYAQVQ